MAISITLKTEQFHQLDLSPVQQVVEPLLAEGTIAAHEQQVVLQIQYDREPDDPRELPEIPEIRLWFLRLDARYPWFPFLLDWKAGELARYSAMLVPHQFSAKEGIQYNPEALELFLMQKVFVLVDWLVQQEIPSQSRLKAFGQMFGYDLEDSLFQLLAESKES